MYYHDGPSNPTAFQAADRFMLPNRKRSQTGKRSSDCRIYVTHYEGYRSCARDMSWRIETIPVIDDFISFVLVQSLQRFVRSQVGEFTTGLTHQREIDVQKPSKNRVEIVQIFALSPSISHTRNISAEFRFISLRIIEARVAKQRSFTYKSIRGGEHAIRLRVFSGNNEANPNAVRTGLLSPATI